MPDVESYYKFSEHLKKIKMEKWIISFFQVEMFPKIVFSGDMSRIIRTLIYEWQASKDNEENIIHTLQFNNSIKVQLLL